MPTKRKRLEKLAAQFKPFDGFEESLRKSDVVVGQDGTITWYAPGWVPPGFRHMDGSIEAESDEPSDLR